VVFIVAIRLHQ
jgi:hypothetical protein